MGWADPPAMSCCSACIRVRMSGIRLVGEGGGVGGWRGEEEGGVAEGLRV